MDFLKNQLNQSGDNEGHNFNMEEIESHLKYKMYNTLVTEQIITLAIKNEATIPKLVRIIPL